MAQSTHSQDLHWFNPDPRAVIPLDGWHISRSLKKLLKCRPFHITINQAFEAVLEGCARMRKDGEGSWINADIRHHYHQLHLLGHAHSVECWQQGSLVGGLYGVSRGGAFFGESMFSVVPNASKIAFCYLLEILLQCGYGLLDTQFVNPHLEQFGVVEVPRTDYLSLLDKSLIITPNPSHKFMISGGKIAASDPSSFRVIRPLA